MTTFNSLGILSTQRVDCNYMKNIYLLKDLARKSRQSIHTVKFYLKLGLLKEIGRGPETNFRYFDDSTVERLNYIRTLKAEKISLKEVQERLLRLPKSVANSQ